MPPLQAFLFDSAGIGEWMILLVVILIVVGPKRLPEVARKMGRMMETVRRAADEFKRQIMTMDQTDESDSSSVTDPSSPPDYNPDTCPYPGHEGDYVRPPEVGEDDYSYNPDGYDPYADGERGDAPEAETPSGENQSEEGAAADESAEGGGEEKQA